MERRRPDSDGPEPPEIGSMMAPVKGGTGPTAALLKEIGRRLAPFDSGEEERREAV